MPIAAALPYIAAATSIYSAFSSRGAGGAQSYNAPPPPPAPAAPPVMNSPQIQQSGNLQRDRAIAAGGIMSNVATGPQGLLGGASTTGKTALGQ